MTMMFQNREATQCMIWLVKIQLRTIRHQPNNGHQIPVNIKPNFILQTHFKGLHHNLKPKISLIMNLLLNSKLRNFQHMVNNRVRLHSSKVETQTTSSIVQLMTWQYQKTRKERRTSVKTLVSQLTRAESLLVIIHPKINWIWCHSLTLLVKRGMDLSICTMLISQGKYHLPHVRKLIVKVDRWWKLEVLTTDWLGNRRCTLRLSRRRLLTWTTHHSPSLDLWRTLTMGISKRGQS